MPEQNVSRLNFNRGKVSQLALSRTDIERVELSAEEQTNYVPRVLGSMMLRPGLEYIDSTKSDAAAFHIPFVKSTDDTALVELTDNLMRVRVDEDIVTRVSVSTNILNDSFTATSPNFDKLTNPAAVPTDGGDTDSVAFSPDGLFMATTSDTSPFVFVYAVSGTTFTKLANAGSQFSATLPTAAANGVVFSPDGSLLVVCHNNSTIPMSVYYKSSGSGTTTVWSKLSDPPGLPGADMVSAAFSPDGSVLVAVSATAAARRAWSIVGSGVSAVFTSLTPPASPAGNAFDVAFNSAGTLCAIAHTTTPFVTIHSVSGTGASMTFTQLSDPANLPAGNGRGVAFSHNGQFMAVGHATTPFVTIYSISGTTFTKLSDPATLPDGVGAHVAFSTDDQYLAVAHATSQYLTLYRYVAGVWTKQTDPGTTPTGDATGVAWSPTNRFLAVNHQASPFITIYEAYHWLDLSESGSTANINTTSGFVALVGSGFTRARRLQGVLVAAADIDVEHAVNVTAFRNPFYIRIGTTAGADDLLRETLVDIGNRSQVSHSLAFTPTEFVFYVDIYNADNDRSAIVQQVSIASAGEMSFVTDFDVTDLDSIRYAQSGDVIYLTASGVGQYKIKRFGQHSWGYTRYLPEDGPFRALTDSQITIAASDLTGAISLTASRPLFKTDHTDFALFRLTSIGQNSSDSFTAANQFSVVEIKVTGVGTQRDLTIARSGTWSATVTLQRSIAAPGAWSDVATFTSNGTATYNDALDNQTIYYRIGIKTGNYTSGTAVIAMNYSSGGIDGVVRIIDVTDPTGLTATALVLSPLGATTATENWQEGAWSDLRGWPSSVCLHEGRLWWAGMDKVYGSASDDYESFDDTIEGDAGPISRSIGEGPVDQINWLLPLQRMIVGTEGSELSAKSNSFDEPLTPSNFTLKAASTHGSADVGPVKIDNSGLFVHRNGERLMQLAYDIDTYDYNTSDLTRLVPEICSGGIVRIAVQRLPDTRIHCVKEDGTVALLIYDRIEDVMGWVDIETDGLIEDVVVLPDTPEDAVYYVVNRTINGGTKRYLERWALESECEGDDITKCLDSYLVRSGAPTTSITGLSHLEGETVAVWADGVDLGTYTVTAGAITLSTASSDVVVGLAYTARYKSTKLAYAAANGTALNMRKRLQRIGLVLYKTHAFGLRIGDSFDFLRGMPTMINNKAVDEDEIYDTFDHDLNAYNTNWSTDSRLCLQSSSPRPATILALVFNIETNG